MRFCKLDWKPDAVEGPPRIISGTRVLYEVDPMATCDDPQRTYLTALLALLAKDIGIEEGRLDAMIEAGRLREIVVRVG